MYDTLDTKNTCELRLVRKARFNPECELTDGVYKYGKIIYPRFSRRNAKVLTAAGAWAFQRSGLFFNRTILITNENGDVLGRLTREWFDRKTVLSMESGFMAVFYRASVWPRVYKWESDAYGKIMHMICHPFSLTDNICFEQSMAPGAFKPLLSFLGYYLTVLARQRKAAH